MPAAAACYHRQPGIVAICVLFDQLTAPAAYVTVRKVSNHVAQIFGQFMPCFRQLRGNCSSEKDDRLAHSGTPTTNGDGVPFLSLAVPSRPDSALSATSTNCRRDGRRRRTLRS